MKKILMTTICLSALSFSVNATHTPCKNEIDLYAYWSYRHGFIHAMLKNHTKAELRPRIKLAADRIQNTANEKFKKMNECMQNL